MQRHKGLERLLEKSGVVGDVRDRGNLLPLAYDGAGRLCVAAATLSLLPMVIRGPQPPDQCSLSL